MIYNKYDAIYSFGLILFIQKNSNCYTSFTQIACFKLEKKEEEEENLD